MANNFGAARAASKKRKLAALDKAALLAPVGSTSAPSDPPGPRPKKTRVERAVNLKWRNVVLPSEIGFDEDGGMLELDEIEGVDVVYKDGRIQFEVSTESGSGQGGGEGS